MSKLEYEIEYLEFIIAEGEEREKGKARRKLHALKTHGKDCPNTDLKSVDPFGLLYECLSCKERIYGSRYLISGLSMNGKGKQNIEVLDAFTGTWYKTDKNGKIPHDNSCSHCGQDMSRLDPKIAAKQFNIQSELS